VKKEREKSGRFSRKHVERARFVAWYATEPFQRQPRTREKLANELHVSRRTLYRWEQQIEDLIPISAKAQALKIHQQTLQSLSARAIGGNMRAMELWLRFFMGEPGT